ncbi:hypothetical protein ACFSVM_02590 [Paenibacillus shunpengii]|uniref:Uncharacterized protein n=1 Tax=Paenibacillus shunpengii TaxID=2054424 RepID=A0ABW5SHU7_9BACL|nr:hypothetical protein [Paenibacillus sp. FSL H7-0326]
MRDELMVNMVRVEELKLHYLGHERQPSFYNNGSEKSVVNKTLKTRLLIAISSLFGRG